MKLVGVIAFLIICLLPIGLLAQGRQIKGRVLDSNGNAPLAGAHVMLQSNWKTGTVSDSEGYYELIIDSYSPSDSLIFTFIGFQEDVIPLSGFQMDQIIYLSEKASSMKEVKVLGEKLIAEEFSIQKIEKLEIYKNPSAKADALLAVNALPSSTTTDETANVSFRGSSPAQTGIFFNHVPIYDAVRFSQLNGMGTFSFFNTEIVKNVQVFAGNPPLEFGNTSSGLIAIQSEDVLVPERLTSILISVASMSLNHRQRTGNNGSLILFGNYQFSAPLKRLNTESLQDIRSFKSTDLGLHWVYRSPKKLSFKIFNYLLNEGYDYNFRSPSYSGSFDQSKFSNLTILNITKKIRAGTLSLNAGHRWSDQLYTYSKAVYDISGNDYYGSLNFQKEKRYSGFKLGIAYDGRYQGFQGVVPEFYYAQGPEHPFESIELTRTQREILDLFFYYKYIPTEKLTLGFAIRKNIPWDGQEHYLSKQGNLDLNINQNHRLKFALGTFNQHILSQESGDPNRINTTQLSLDHQFDSRITTLKTSIFHKKSSFINLWTEWNSGIEIALNVRPHSNLDMNISFTGLGVEREIEDIRFPSQYDLPYFVRLGLEWNFIKMYTVGIRGIFREGTWYQPITDSEYNYELDAYRPILSGPINSVRYPEYNLVDISISSVFAIGNNIGMVVFASAGNIFNFKNIRQYSYNRDYSIPSEELFSRRTIYFGTMINF